MCDNAFCVIDRPLWRNGVNRDMTALPGKAPISLPIAAVDLENQLKVALLSAADEVAHSECFDDEQRSEVYSILHALTSDADRHRQWVTLWADQTRKEAPDA